MEPQNSSKTPRSQKKSVRIAVFSTKNWVSNAFDEANKQYLLDITYLESRLYEKTARLAEDYDVVCAFVNDVIDAPVLEKLKQQGVSLVAMRCSGFNNVDINKARELGIGVVRVPAYSPYAVAEHALGMILCLNRKLHKAYTRVRDGNFALDGLLGFDLHGKTVGIIGTGKIGRIFARIIQGFGCNILGNDKYPSEDFKGLGGKYVDLHELYKQSDIISLHCPLTYETYHIINEYAIAAMKPGVMIINTSRGPLIDTGAVIGGLKQGKVGHLGLDVYEEEGDLFFEDLSEQVIHDDTFVRLQTFPNVLITAHQAFFTREAIHNIAETTLENIREYFEKGSCVNAV